MSFDIKSYLKDLAVRTSFNLYQVAATVFASFILVHVSLAQAPLVSLPAGNAFRWLSGNNVNLRSSALVDAPIIARLPINTQVTLLPTVPINGFCEVSLMSSPRVEVASGGIALQGFLACQYLSVQSINTVALASQSSIPSMDVSTLTASTFQNEKAERRFVVGNGVNLRSGANLKADVLMRLPINTEVRLVSAPAKDDVFCEVWARPAKGAQGSDIRGFTACQYLSNQVVQLARVDNANLPDGKTNPAYNPERAFWIQPTLERLFAYGSHLEATRISEPIRQGEKEGSFANALVNRPVDPSYESMKLRLAQGFISDKPDSTDHNFLADWQEMKRTISTKWPLQDALRKQIKQRMQGRGYSESEWSDFNQGNVSVKAMNESLLDASLLGDDRSELAGLIHFTDLPIAKPSFFKTDPSILLYPQSAESISKAWKIPLIAKLQRGANYVTGGNYGTPGISAIWDVSTATLALQRTVFLNSLHSRAGLMSKSTLMETTTSLGARSEEMCEGHVDGFSFSVASPTPKASGIGVEPASLRRGDHPMMYFYSANAIDTSKVKTREVNQRLSLADTGMYSSYALFADIDGDGVADLATIEALAPAGPDHLTPSPAGPWPMHRIYLINWNGRWKIVSTDKYSLGCGC